MEKKLTFRGLTPKLMTLDNEASKLIKEYLYDQDINFQLVPLYCHRRNAAERAIFSFKDHLIAGLCFTDKAFPMHLWDRLLPQAILTLNMLRTSRINPTISAATHLDGKYEYNKAHMAPSGTIIIAHETPNRRRTWAPHGQDDLCIGPALEQYRCYTVYISKTRSERVVETVFFSPIEVQLPFQSTRDVSTEAAKQLTYALTNPQPAGPFAQVDHEQLIALKKLAAILKGVLPKHKQRTTTLLISNTSESPQRVDCTVSTHTKSMAASAPRVVGPTSSNQKNPNSHRRLQTTPRRCVTPITPHHMTSRSA
jgi:hypothetical protein